MSIMAYVKRGISTFFPPACQGKIMYNYKKFKLLW
jgi:hypothetical protein